MVKPDFSVIIPSYTGGQHLDALLNGLLAQKTKFEVIIVIDGPELLLRQIAEHAKAKFAAKSIKLSVHQFPHNRGRFAARLKGAELASAQRLVFCDDRVLLDKGYLAELWASNQDVVIPNTIQVASTSPINRLLYLIRRKAYRDWGEEFKSHKITAENFERSAKGTTSLMIPKDLFIDICKELRASQKDLKTVSDDTKVLRGVIDRGRTIWRSSEAKIYYQPRGTVTQQLQHLYDRGPKFVDYYLRPGTRFYYPLILSFFGLVSIGLLVILNPAVFVILSLGVLAADVAMAGWLAEKPADFFVALIALPVIGVVTGVGMISGLVGKLWQ